MIELAIVLTLGSTAAIIVLMAAPLSFVYVAAFVTLTPLLGMALWLAGGFLRVAIQGVRDAFRILIHTQPQ